MFRFCDLPSEIRNKIYRELLCDATPKPTTVEIGRLPAALRNVDTSILLTNSVVNCEARDVMIKTNRFVKITSASGLPLPLLLQGMQVPIVTSNKETVENFGGYVLAVDLDYGKTFKDNLEQSRTSTRDACTLMILHRDLDLFCRALTDGDAHAPGFSVNLQISITVAPVLVEHTSREIAPSLQDFFSKATQETLLAPFKSRLRGYSAVKIQGYVDQDLANAIREEMGRQRWSDFEKILADFAAAKAEGSRLFQQRHLKQSSLIWMDAAVDIDTMVESSSWPTLVKSGGERFVSRLAEVYFLVRLNIAHIHITNMHTSAISYLDGILAEDALSSATRSLKQNYWMEGYRYRPSRQLLAKLQYRGALLLRLQADPSTANQALDYINIALRLQPDDAAILRERNRITAWMEQVL